MSEEVYEDQFTPWVKNHWAADGQVPADVFGGALLGNIQARDQTGLQHTSNLMYATVTTNYYLGLWSANSILEER